MADNPYKIQIGKRILMDLISSIANIAIFLVVYFVFFIYFIYSNPGFNKIIPNANSLFLTPILFFAFVYLLIIGFKILYKLAYYSSLSYSIDKDNIVYRGGIVSRFERSLPYSKIQHVIIYRTLWQRIFGLSSVSIETARDGGMNQGNRYNRNLGMMSGIYIPDINSEDAVKLKDYVITNTNKFKPIAGI